MIFPDKWRVGPIISNILVNGLNFPNVFTHKNLWLRLNTRLITLLNYCFPHQNLLCHHLCSLLFLVGVFLVKRARLLQWLVFFFFFVRLSLIAYLPIFVSYSLLPKVLSTWLWTHAKASTLRWKPRSENPERSALSNFFGAVTFPAPFSALWDFFRNF